MSSIERLMLMLAGVLSVGCDAPGDDPSTGTTGASSSSSTTTSPETTLQVGDGSSDTTGGAPDDTTGTGSLDGPSTTDTGEPSGFEHCEPSVPRPMGGLEMGQWENEQDVGIVATIPMENPAGGYIRATLTPGQARGSLAVYDSLHEFIVSTAEGDHADPVELGFLAAPGTVYTLEARQEEAALPEQYPTEWSISWEATSIPDCWEPNEEVSDAPTVALDEPISGYINGDLRGGEEQVYPNSFHDFYLVDLGGPGTLHVAMTQVPDDGRIRVMVMNWAGYSEGEVLHPKGEAGLTFEGDIEIEVAGTYTVSASPSFLGYGALYTLDDEIDLPSSWATPYTLELGFTPI